LPPAKLERSFDIQRQLANVGTIFDRVLGDRVLGDRVLSKEKEAQG